MPHFTTNRRSMRRFLLGRTAERWILTDKRSWGVATRLFSLYILFTRKDNFDFATDWRPDRRASMRAPGTLQEEGEPSVEGL
jgi:hypothetical protein